jgi:uncharacterized protein
VVWPDPLAAGLAAGRGGGSGPMAFLFAAMGIGTVIGLVLGLLGGGGAILAVPALVYILHAPPHTAVAASLAIVAVGALVGVVWHARQGGVAWATAARLGVTGAIGAMVGAWLGQFISGERLLALLGLFMLVAAWLMGRRRTPTIDGGPAHPRRALLLGLGLGVLTGFFGVGGGFLIVPALTLGLGLPMRLAVGTSLAVIAANSLAGLVGHLGAGTVEWGLTTLVAAGTIGGALIGSRMAGLVPDRQLRTGFAGLVAAVAIYLIYRNAAVLVGVPAMARALGT